MPASEHQPVRWGLIGAGKIADDFAQALSATSGAVKQAVAVRDPAKARAFAQKHGFASAHESLDDLLGDPNVDIVYVATPTSLHHDHGLRTLSAGKALLCEKPFTRNEREAAELVALARARGLFCMEAMWVRFNPLIQSVRDMVRNGDLGRICASTMAVGYAKDLDGLGQLQDARGAGLTFGCYGINLAFFLFGPPAGWSSQSILTPGGADVTCAVDLRYAGHTVSVVASVGGTLSNELDVAGAAGAVRVMSPFIDATRLQMRRQNAPRGLAARGGELVGKLAAPLLDMAGRRSPLRGSGLRGEIAESMRCLRLGMGESPMMPLDETLAVHRILDDARGAAGSPA